MAVTFNLSLIGNNIHITPKLPDVISECLKNILSYTPKGAENAPSHIANKWIYRKGEKPKYNPAAHWDGTKSLFHKGHGKSNYFPVGLLPKALAYLKTLEVHTQMRFILEPFKLSQPNNKTLEGKRVTLRGKKIKIHLREYQPTQVDELVNAPFGRGMIESPTASGKSVTISELIYRFPKETILVTVPSLSLLRQTSKTIEGLIGEPVGTFGDSIFNPKRVTVSTIQSLFSRRNKPEIIEWLSKTQMWIVDEAHMAASEQFQVVSDLLISTSRRYGVSATLRREAGDEMLFYGLIGPCVHKVSAEELIKKGYLANPIIEMHICEHNYQHDPRVTGSKKPQFPLVEHACLTEATYRQELILKQVARVTELGELPCIIMVADNLELGSILHDQIARMGRTAYLSGVDSSKIRDEVIEQVDSGDIPYLICSRIFDEGIDIPRIKSVILAGGGASGNKAAQRIGRGLRIDPVTGKTYCRIIDIDDRERFFLTAHSGIRKTWYELLFPGHVTTWQNGKPAYTFGGPLQNGS